MSSEPDPEALQQRIDELEATVQKMLPGRRAVLAAGAGAAAGAFGMQRASNVGEAADGTAVGQIGTSSEKVNVVAHDVTSDSVDTESLSIEEGGTSESALIAVAATGSTTLSSGAAVVDTGLSAADATFYLALGVDDPNADTKISGRLFWDDSAGTYKVEFVETETSVGNPTVNYDILRVR